MWRFFLCGVAIAMAGCATKYTGRVVDTHGRPVANASIDPWRPAGPSFTRSEVQIAGGKTDSSGRFSFSSELPITRLTVWGPYDSRGNPCTETVYSPQTTDLVIVFHKNQSDCR